MTMPDSAVDLHENVRSAVAAELTTLPVYLYPYWSIKPASDNGSPAAQRARSDIMAVIVEEMLHMALASNMLNALGGTPDFTTHPYVPTFPGRLLRSKSKPAGWGTAVDLTPLSHEAIEMMLAIELPEWDAPDGPTLGDFYHDFIEACLPDDDAEYGSGRQIAPWDNPGPGSIVAVNSRETAIEAITEILDQGEGVSRATHDDGDHELAHYWRFRGVADAIADGSIDLRKDVYPVVAAPKAHLASYTPEQRQANEAFNEVYSRMLDQLEVAFAGDRPDVYPVATGLMKQLHLLADQIRGLGVIPGTQFVAGPTFEYQRSRQ